MGEADLIPRPATLHQEGVEDAEKPKELTQLEDAVGQMISPAKLREILGDRQIVSGKMAEYPVWTANEQDSYSEPDEQGRRVRRSSPTYIHYRFAELNVTGGGKIFITDTPTQYPGSELMFETGVVFSRDKWIYVFDGDHTTKIEGPNNQKFEVTDRGAEDMLGLREKLMQAIPMAPEQGVNIHEVKTVQYGG